MCKMKVAVNKLMLGNRELGWELWDGQGVLEMTSRQIKDTINKEERVYGLRINNAGELELDADDFFTKDLLLHSHIGNYQAMNNESSISNVYYICLGCRACGGKKVYELITSRFHQLHIVDR